MRTQVSIEAGKLSRKSKLKTTNTKRKYSVIMLNLTTNN